MIRIAEQYYFSFIRLDLVLFMLIIKVNEHLKDSDLIQFRKKKYEYLKFYILGNFPFLLKMPFYNYTSTLTKNRVFRNFNKF